MILRLLTRRIIAYFVGEIVRSKFWEKFRFWLVIRCLCIIQVKVKVSNRKYKIMTLEFRGLS